MTGNRRGTFDCVLARPGDERLGGRRSSGVQDLLVSLRIAARTGVGTREMLGRLSLKLMVVSMDNRGKIVDGDVNARVRDSSKGGSIVVWLMTDGREEGDVGGSGYIKGRRRGGRRSSAALKRTGSQTKEDGKVRMRLGRRGRTIGRKRDVLCTDSVAAVEGDRSCQCRVGRTERTAEEREEEWGHDMGRRGGGQEDMLNNSIIANVGDLVHGVIIARRCRCRGGGRAGRAGQERRQEREGWDQDRGSIWEEEIVDRQPHLFSNVRPLDPPSPPPRRPHSPLPQPASVQVPEDQVLFLQIQPHSSRLALAPAPARFPGDIAHDGPSLARKERKL